MISVLRRAALCAAIVCISAIPASAQQQPGTRSQGSNDYKPPARFIAQEDEKPLPKSAAAEAPSASTATKTVGLISIVGESFSVKTVGITVFGNEEQSFPSAAWKIDDRVAASVGRILKKNFKVKRIPVPAGTYAAFQKGDFFFKSVDDEFTKFISKYTAGQNCDYFLVIAPGGSPVGSTNQTISGLGILRSSSLFAKAEHVHALSSLTVFDGKMKSLRSERGSIGQGTFLVGIKGPHVDLSEAEMLPPDPKAAFADPRAQKIAWELLEKSLTMTVPKLLAAN